MKLVPAFAALALCIGATTLSAQLVTYTIDGTITSVLHKNSPSGLGSVFTKNENFELKFTGNASDPAAFSLPFLGLTQFDLQSGEITTGTETFLLSSDSLTLTQGFGATFLTFAGTSTTPEFSLTATLGSWTDLYPSGAFPTTLPPLTSFNLAKTFTLEEFSQAHGNFEAFGKITSIDVTATPVPEPSTYSLAAAGLLGLGAIVRRRRRAA